jgi:hypothetical protein
MGRLRRTDLKNERGLQNQLLANERGTLCGDVIFDRITLQNPVNLVYRYTTPHIRLVFLTKNQIFGHASIILQSYKTISVLGLLFSTAVHALVLVVPLVLGYSIHLTLISPPVLGYSIHLTLVSTHLGCSAAGIHLIVSPRAHSPCHKNSTCKFLHVEFFSCMYTWCLRYYSTAVAFEKILAYELLRAQAIFNC